MRKRDFALALPQSHANDGFAVGIAGKSSEIEEAREENRTLAGSCGGGRQPAGSYDTWRNRMKSAGFARVFWEEREQKRIPR